MNKSGLSTEETVRHTPGPWQALMGQFDYGNDGSRRVMFGDPNTEAYGRIATVDTKAERKLRGKNATPYDAPDAERDANARLIAAAPELLAALREIAEFKLPMYPNDWRRLKRQADAAIAKARGQ